MDGEHTVGGVRMAGPFGREGIMLKSRGTSWSAEAGDVTEITWGHLVGHRCTVLNAMEQFTAT